MAEDATSQPVRLSPSESEDFSTDYANNVQFEPSVWDLKLIFGQLDQRPGKAIVDYHTAITIPWIQAKILSYYLQLNIAAYEHTNGRISVPASVIPRIPEPPSHEVQESAPAAEAVYELSLELHNKIFE